MKPDASYSHEWLNNGVAVVRVKGELDVFEAPPFRKYVVEHVVTDERCRHLLIDVSGVTYTESTALGVMVGLYQRLQASTEGAGLYAFVGTPQHLRKVFAITGLLKIFPQYSSLEEALTAVENGEAPQSPK